MTPTREQQQFYLSPELGHRLAAIDIGSNSLRLVVAEALRDGNYRILDEEKETTRLAGKLNSTGRLAPDAVERAMTALGRMKQIADGFQVRELRTIATCAVREAADGEAFCARVKSEVGLEVEVISGDQEARLAFFSVARNFELEGKEVAVADIGGGSTEIVLSSGDIVESVCTTPLGAVRLTEMYADDNGLYDDARYGKLRAWIDRELKRRTRQAILRPHLLIGSGGTFTCLAEMTMAGKGQTMPLRGYEVTRAEVSHLADRLRKMSPKARRGVPGLSPDRADIITAGVTIVDRLMQHFGVNRVQIHDRGVRDGLLLTMIDQSLGRSSENPHDREAAIERFAANCGTDLKHGRQVARLAGLILSQLIGRFELKAEDRPLLEAAARLQDVGYLINYDDHHKHSYHLILNSRLAGFKPRELEIIANVARYHRGAEPKKKHDNFGRLSSDDRALVKKLAAVLRIAGGLDRSNSQQVQAVAVAVQKGCVTMRVLANQNPDVDVWAAQRRAEMFEDVFDVELLIEWHDPNRPASNGSATKRDGAEAETKAAPTASGNRPDGSSEPPSAPAKPTSDSPGSRAAKRKPRGPKT